MRSSALVLAGLLACSGRTEADRPTAPVVADAKVEQPRDAGVASAAGPATGLWRVRDLGVRCIAAPCFSMEATPEGGGAPVPLSDLELAALGVSQEQAMSIFGSIMEGKTLVRGEVLEKEKAGPAGKGRVLVVREAVPAK